MSSCPSKTTRHENLYGPASHFSERSLPRKFRKSGKQSGSFANVQTVHSLGKPFVFNGRNLEIEHLSKQGIKTKLPFIIFKPSDSLPKCVVTQEAECDKLRSANRPHEALEAITACLKLEPFNIRMLRKRVILCQSMQDWDTCKRDCATILKWYAVQRKGHNNSICKEALAVLTSIDKKESQHAMGMTMTVTTMSASRLRENSLMPLFNEALTTSTSTAQLRDHYNAPFTDSRFGY